MLTADNTLQEWLQYLDKSTIKLGLDRAKKVYHKLIQKQNSTIITITGTNGKGSSAAFLESIYLSAGYTVGKLSSPELLLYNEQITINGKNASDRQICLAFAKIEQARGDTFLSYFEFLTLAGLLIFASNGVAITILEVGLGGRLDATNIIDCDCAIITNISLDHCHYLGNTRDAIALEKVAIARANKPLLCADNNPPDSLVSYINTKKIPSTFVRGNYNETVGLLGNYQKINAKLAQTTVKTLQNKHFVSDNDIHLGIKKTSILGRLQHIRKNNINIILDVAHNEASSDALLEYLQSINCTKENTIAIFSALKDKNISAIVGKISVLISTWHLLPIIDRRFDMSYLLTNTKNTLISNLHKHTIKTYNNINSALTNSYNKNIKNIVIFGSFHIVAYALKSLNYE